MEIINPRSPVGCTQIEAVAQVAAAVKQSHAVAAAIGKNGHSSECAAWAGALESHILRLAHSTLGAVAGAMIAQALAHKPTADEIEAAAAVLRIVGKPKIQH